MCFVCALRLFRFPRQHLQPNAIARQIKPAKGTAMVERIKDAFGEYGKAAIALLAAIAVGLIGWNLIKTNGHDASLATLTAQSESTHSLVQNLAGTVRELASSIEHRNQIIDDKIGRIVDTAAEVRDEVKELQAASAQHERDLTQMAPRRFKTE